MGRRHPLLIGVPVIACLMAMAGDSELPDELAGALELFARQQAEQLVDAFDPGEINSALFLPRDLFVDPDAPDDLIFRFADEAFELERRTSIGFGNGLTGPPGGSRAPPNLRRIHHGSFGGPDAISCAGCHGVGGLNGAGTQTQNALFDGDGVHLSSALERSAPHVLGLGAIQALADEMTAALKAHRQSAVSEALFFQTEVRRLLRTHGVEFGELVVDAQGVVDTSGLTGVDTDLRVKPFGWKGNFASLRSISDDSLNVHFGLQTAEIIQESLDAGDPSRVGDPQARPFDPDGDLVGTESLPTELDGFEFYLSMLEIPIIAPPEDAGLLEYWREGVGQFQQMGCINCHAPLRLKNPVNCTGVREGVGRCVDLLTDSEEPRLGAHESILGELFPLEPGNGYLVLLFSDLKRHDMGPELAEPRAHRGVPGNMWMTRPLWGLADTPPYLHDGRASTVDEAIAYHGGEGAPARDAYAAASENERAALRVFLMSLIRQPKLLVQ